jgi:hypothetical protein
MIKRVLLKLGKKDEGPWLRKNIFRTKHKFGGKCYKMIIDGGSMNNLVSTKMMQK